MQVQLVKFEYLRKCLFVMLNFYLCVGLNTVSVADVIYEPENLLLESNQSTSKEILIDTDMLIDDWVAVLYLLRQPEIKVVGITISATGELGTRAALSLLKFTEHDDIPVAVGKTSTFKTNEIFDLKDYIKSEIDLLPKLEVDYSMVETDAVEFLHRKLQESELPVTILALGTLTNIANLLETYPGDKEKIQKIVSMSGAIDVDGNVSCDGQDCDYDRLSEYNLYMDPEAAKFVLDSGVPIDFISLDATNNVPLKEDFISKVKTVPTSDRCTDYLITLLESKLGDRDYYLWDPLTAVVLAYGEESFDFSPVCIDIALESKDKTMKGAMFRCKGKANSKYLPAASYVEFTRLFISNLSG